VVLALLESDGFTSVGFFRVENFHHLVSFFHEALKLNSKKVERLTLSALGIGFVTNDLDVGHLDFVLSDVISVEVKGVSEWVEKSMLAIHS